MKSISFICGLWLLSATLLSAAEPDVIARIHFLGGDKIGADANSKAFAGEFCSPEARALENQTLNKMAAVPYTWFKAKLPPGAGDGTAQLRPLLDDLLKAEWIFQVRDAPGSPEYALAIRLPPDRAQLWDKNLRSLLQQWSGANISHDKDGNWELKKHEVPSLIEFSHWNDWVVIDCGNELKLREQIRLTIAKPVAATASLNWLETELDWPRLAQLYPALAKFDFPKVQLEVSGHGGELRITGKLNLSSPLPSLVQWLLPTNAIHEPFNSFVAVRGIAPWLERQGWMQRYQLNPDPNQFFIWSQPMMAFQTYAAAPVSNPNIALGQLYAKISASQNSSANPVPGTMPITVQIANNEITWRGIFDAAPYVRTWQEKSGGYLLAGLFPNVGRTQPLPRELLNALNQPNLVYYGWETTSNRAPQILRTAQLGMMLTGRRQLDANSAAAKWFEYITPKLGPSLTTATKTSASEIAFTRISPGGLTAIEFYALAAWLEAPNFPGCDLKLPPRPTFKHPPLIHGKVPVPATAPGDSTQMK